MPTVPQAIPEDAINQLPDDSINQRNALDHRDQPGLNRWVRQTEPFVRYKQSGGNGPGYLQN